MRYAILYVLVGALIIWAAASIKIGVWNECRAAGNSGWYCWQLVQP